MKCSKINTGTINCNAQERNMKFIYNDVDFSPLEYDVSKDDKEKTTASLLLHESEYEKLSKEFWNNEMANQIWLILSNKSLTRKIRKYIFNWGVRKGAVTFKEINDIKVNRYKYKCITGENIVINDIQLKVIKRIVMFDMSIQDDCITIIAESL